MECRGGGRKRRWRGSRRRFYHRRRGRSCSFRAFCFRPTLSGGRFALSTEGVWREYQKTRCRIFGRQTAPIGRGRHCRLQVNRRVESSGCRLKEWSSTFQLFLGEKTFSPSSPKAVSPSSFA